MPAGDRGRATTGVSGRNGLVLARFLPRGGHWPSGRAGSYLKSESFAEQDARSHDGASQSASPCCRPKSSFASETGARTTASWVRHTAPLRQTSCEVTQYTYASSIQALFSARRGRPLRTEETRSSCYSLSTSSWRLTCTAKAARRGAGAHKAARNPPHPSASLASISVDNSPHRSRKPRPLESGSPDDHLRRSSWSLTVPASSSRPVSATVDSKESASWPRCVWSRTRLPTSGRCCLGCHHRPAGWWPAATRLQLSHSRSSRRCIV